MAGAKLEFIACPIVMYTQDVHALSRVVSLSLSWTSQSLEAFDRHRDITAHESGTLFISHHMSSLRSLSHPRLHQPLGSGLFIHCLHISVASSIGGNFRRLPNLPCPVQDGADWQLYGSIQPSCRREEMLDRNRSSDGMAASRP